jgi:hypothetical protein
MSRCADHGLDAGMWVLGGSTRTANRSTMRPFPEAERSGP